jgi:hypothetical protein
LRQQVGREVDVGHHHRHVEARREVAAEDVGEAQIRPAGLDVEGELGDVAAAVEDARDGEVNRGHVDVGRGHLDVGVEREVEGQRRQVALEDLEQARVRLPAHAGRQAELQAAVLDRDVGEIEVGQIDRHVDVGDARQRRQRGEVELAVAGARDDERLGDRDQHARGTRRQPVDHVEQAHHGDDEIHPGDATEQGRHVGGQVDHRIIAAHEAGDAGNRRGQGVDDRHDRVGDVLDHLGDRVQEAGKKVPASR